MEQVMSRAERNSISYTVPHKSGYDGASTAVQVKLLRYFLSKGRMDPVLVSLGIVVTVQCSRQQLSAIAALQGGRNELKTCTTLCPKHLAWFGLEQHPLLVRNWMLVFGIWFHRSIAANCHEWNLGTGTGTEGPHSLQSPPVSSSYSGSPLSHNNKLNILTPGNQKLENEYKQTLFGSVFYIASSTSAMKHHKPFERLKEPMKGIKGEHLNLFGFPHLAK
ncbi:hypothetical protein V6N11_038355 [Hibiscus sabdariffa]|uniref:Uncharacterized protein n=1 Tax=Hibiscus sabdariffa TaxID=183260 RepID=A0ABR2SJP1_9ROSI